MFFVLGRIQLGERKVNFFRCFVFFLFFFFFLQNGEKKMGETLISRDTIIFLF